MTATNNTTQVAKNIHGSIKNMFLPIEIYIRKEKFIQQMSQEVVKYRKTLTFAQRKLVKSFVAAITFFTSEIGLTFTLPGSFCAHSGGKFCATFTC